MSGNGLSSGGISWFIVQFYYVCGMNWPTKLELGSAMMDILSMHLHFCNQNGTILVPPNLLARGSESLAIIIPLVRFSLREIMPIHNRLFLRKAVRAPVCRRNCGERSNGVYRYGDVARSFEVLVL